MENVTQWWKQSESFFQNSGEFFWFSKRAGEFFPFPPSCKPVCVAEYALISLKMLKYPWTNCSDYARALNMLDHLTCLSQGSEYGTVVYAMVTQSSEYV